MVAMGTRPEAIKLAGVITRLGSRARVVHTGQHYDTEMWDNVLADLPGVEVRHSIEVGGRSRGEQIGRATDQITRYLIENPARVMVVQGDTNSTLAGALAAVSLDIPVVHVEAGLRSFDRSMPEETNRLLVDTVADLGCAPVQANADQLAREGVPSDRIVVTGNTLADAMEIITPSTDSQREFRRAVGLAADQPYVLCTVHRAALVDDAESLRRVLEALADLAGEVPVVLPLHPRTAAKASSFGLDGLLDRLTVIPPTNPAQFMALEAGASLILSDSGGVQEEACLLRRPLLVLRNSTERPELLDGWCRLLGDAEPREAVRQAWQDAPAWQDAIRTKSLPYPTEPASDTIVAEISRRWLT